MSDGAAQYQIFCLYTNIQHVDEVMEGLKRYILEPDEPVFYPKVEKLKKVGEETVRVYPPMFPGYLFIESSRPQNLYLRVREAWGKAIFQYCQLLRNNDYIYPITSEEEERIATLCDEHYILRSSTGYKSGDRLIITDGPLKNHTGMIIKVNRHKKIAVLSIPFMGEKREVIVSLDIVRKNDAIMK